MHITYARNQYFVFAINSLLCFRSVKYFNCNVKKKFMASTKLVLRSSENMAVYGKNSSLSLSSLYFTFIDLSFVLERTFSYIIHCIFIHCSTDCSLYLQV